MSDKPNIALAENLITLLAHSDEHGRVVANLIDPELFEGDYREVAERIVDYWHRYNQAPKAHTADLFSDILDDSANRRGRTIRNMLMNMLQLYESVNVQYVLDQLRVFTRMQRLKQAIYSSAERLSSEQEMAVDDVEQLWSDLLRAGEVEFDLGLKLNEIGRITDAVNPDGEDEFAMGVIELDRRGVIPRRGEATLFLGAKGTGKSWAAVHVGKTNLLRRKRVLHVSLEMSEEQIGARYYQALFGVTRKVTDVPVTLLEKDESGNIEDIKREIAQPDFTLASAHVLDEIKHHSEYLGTRFHNIIIKRFPTRGLTVRMLEGYLDSLEVLYKFMPDLLILDYIGIMKTDAKDHRTSLGRTFEDIRGLLVKRNMAGFIPHQVGRAAVQAKHVLPTHVAEDWSLVHTADQVLTLSVTQAEQKLGLARLLVGHARDVQDGFGALIVQNYELGQFCLDSAYLKSSYFDMLEEYKTEEGIEDDDDQYGD